MNPAPYLPSAISPAAPASASLEVPQGQMAKHIGRKYPLSQLDKDEYYPELERRFLPFVRAYEVTSMIGSTFEFGPKDDICKSLLSLLEATLPGIEWQLVDEWADARFQKALLIHTSIAAPLDELTSQRMSLEIYAELISVDGRPIDWDFKCSHYLRQDKDASVPGNRFVVEVAAATYANISHPGIGVPSYM